MSAELKSAADYAETIGLKGKLWLVSKGVPYETAITMTGTEVLAHVLVFRELEASNALEVGG